MAEIHVEARKNRTNASWILNFFLLVIAAVVVWFIVKNNEDTQQEVPEMPTAPMSVTHSQNFFPLHADIV